VRQLYLIIHTGSPLQPLVIIPTPHISLTSNNFNSTLRCLPNKSTLQYYWEKQNSDLSSRAHDVHSSNLTITNLKPGDSGEYRCTISNSTGKITSDYAKLDVEGN